MKLNLQKCISKRRTHLDVQVRAKDVTYDLVVDEPAGEVLPNVLDLDDALIVAQLVEQVDVAVDLRDARQTHRQRRAREVLERQVHAVLVERHGRV